MKRLLSGLRFLADDFGPLIVFLPLEHWYGVKPAIAGALAVSLLIAGARYWKGGKTSLFFKFSVGVAIGFGLVDLYLASSVLYRFEAAASSVLFGLYFGATLFAPKSLIEEFHDKTLKPGETTDDGERRYMRILTAVWSAHFFLKAVAYVYIAKRMSFAEATALRAVIGNVCLVTLLLGERLFRKQLYRLVIGEHASAVSAPPS